MTTTHPTLDEFMSLLDNADAHNLPDVGAVDAFLICLLMKWEADEEENAERMADMNENLSEINSVLTNEERLEALNRLMEWAKTDEWITDRMVAI